MLICGEVKLTLIFKSVVKARACALLNAGHDVRRVELSPQWTQISHKHKCPGPSRVLCGVWSGPGANGRERESTAHVLS